MPQRSMQAVLDGHIPSLDRAAEIAEALGYELTIRPRDPSAVPEATPAKSPQFRRGSPPAAVPAPAAGAVFEPVADRRIAEVLAVLADTFDALGEPGRELLLAHFWATHPALRERGRRLGRVVGGLGWRVVEGRSGRAAARAE